MLLLDSTAKTLELALTGAATSTPLVYYVTWADHTSTAFTPGSDHGNLSTVDPIVVVEAPAAAAQRQVKFMSVRNADTDQATVRVLVVEGDDAFEIARVVLEVGDLLQYTDGAGFSVMNQGGSIKRVLTTVTLEGGTGWDGLASVVGDGVETEFDLPHADVDSDPRNHMVTQDGLVMEIGAGNDYVISDGSGVGGVDQLVFEVPPLQDTKVAIRYMRVVA